MFLLLRNEECVREKVSWRWRKLSRLDISKRVECI